MTKVAITEQYLTDIADAIRAKTGMSTATYYPSQMATAISTISGSGGITPTGTISITENGTYNVTNYASASVSVPTGSTINNQNKTVSPTTSQQSITYDSGYTGLGTVTINAMPAGTAGTPTASKGTVSNNSISVTPSVTNTTGYITGSTKTGTAVTVSASELVSGNKSITSNGSNIDVTNYATVSVNVSSGGITPTGNINITQAGETDVTNYAVATVPSATLEGKVISDTPTMGIQTVQGVTTVYASYENYDTITPANTAGWIGTSNSINCVIQVNGTYTLTDITFPTSTAASATSGYTSKAIITPSTSAQYINIPTGYNAAGAYYKINAMSTMTLPTSAAASATSGYTSKATISRSTSDQYINIPPGYNSAGAYYKISAVANGSATGPSSLSGTSATVSTGTNTLTLTKTGVTTTPTVSAGYVSSATASTATVTLTASVTTKAAATITPGTTDQTIASGTYLTGTQTISGDANLIASNIKKDVTIFGKTGTYEGSGGGGSSMQVATATATPSSAAQIIAFTNVPNEPTSFVILCTEDLSVDSNIKIASVVYDGTNIIGQAITNTSNYNVSSITTGFYYNYNGSTLEVIYNDGSGVNFQPKTYSLVYTYGGSSSNIGTADVQVGSGATSITFTGLEDEPEYFSCIFKSNFGTSNGYQRTIGVVYDGSNTYGMEMDSSAKASTIHWSYSYNNGSLTITSQSTNAGGYFHQPGYYQLIYAIGGDSTLQKKTVTPTSSDQTITADTAQGYTALSQVKVEGVTCSNLTAANIKSGVTIKVGTSTDDDSVTSVTGSYEAGGGGGDTKFVTGTFTTSSSTSTNGTVSITYSGSGYPVMLVVVVEGGMYNSSVSGWYSSVTRYAVGQFTLCKGEATTTPSYSTSGSNNYGSVELIYKNSTSTSTSYSSTRAANANSYSSSTANGTSTTCVRWTGNKTISYRTGGGGSSSYGLLAGTTYRYYVYYSA